MYSASGQDRYTHERQRVTGLVLDGIGQLCAEDDKMCELDFDQELLQQHVATYLITLYTLALLHKYTLKAITHR